MKDYNFNVHFNLLLKISKTHKILLIKKFKNSIPFIVLLEIMMHLN